MAFPAGQNVKKNSAVDVGVCIKRSVFLSYFHCDSFLHVQAIYFLEKWENKLHVKINRFTIYDRICQFESKFFSFIVNPFSEGVLNPLVLGKPLKGYIGKQCRPQNAASDQGLHCLLTTIFV